MSKSTIPSTAKGSRHNIQGEGYVEMIGTRMTRTATGKPLRMQRMRRVDGSEFEMPTGQVLKLIRVPVPIADPPAPAPPAAVDPPAADPEPPIPVPPPAPEPPPPPPIDPPAPPVTPPPPPPKKKDSFWDDLGI